MAQGSDTDIATGMFPIIDGQGVLNKNVNLSRMFAKCVKFQNCCAHTDYNRILFSVRRACVYVVVELRDIVHSLVVFSRSMLHFFV